MNEGWGSDNGRVFFLVGGWMYYLPSQFNSVNQIKETENDK